LPLFKIKSVLFGNYLISIPFAESGGILADNFEIESALQSHGMEIAREMNVDYLELRNNRPIQGLYTKDLYFNFSREIFPTPDENLNAIPRKSRAAVRKGIKEGLVSQFGKQGFDDFYEIMARSYHNLGTPVFKKGFFRKFLEVFGENSNILLIRTEKGVPVAGVLTFYFKDRVMPYYAGSRFEYRALCPNDFMYWELMRDGCEKGYKIFDFGRSKMDTGSFSFKVHWGFQPQPLVYQYYLVKIKELPNLSPANPKYQKKIELWQKLPFKLTKILGPPIARYLA
jgi:FemAB-related protein (PEP-CTERM system-associated)